MNYIWWLLSEEWFEIRVYLSSSFPLSGRTRRQKPLSFTLSFFFRMIERKWMFVVLSCCVLCLELCWDFNRRVGPVVGGRRMKISSVIMLCMISGVGGHYVMFLLLCLAAKRRWYITFQSYPRLGSFLPQGTWRNIIFQKLAPTCSL